MLSLGTAPGTGTGPLPTGCLPQPAFGQVQGRCQPHRLLSPSPHPALLRSAMPRGGRISACRCPQGKGRAYPQSRATSTTQEPAGQPRTQAELEGTVPATLAGCACPRSTSPAAAPPSSWSPRAPAGRPRARTTGVKGSAPNHAPASSSASPPLPSCRASTTVPLRTPRPGPSAPPGAHVPKPPARLRAAAGTSPRSSPHPRRRGDPSWGTTGSCRPCRG